MTGFLSSSTSANIFTGATFALLCVCLLVSIVPSPFYTRLHGLLWGHHSWDDNESDDPSDAEAHHHDEKGVAATDDINHEIHYKAPSIPSP